MSIDAVDVQISGKIFFEKMKISSMFDTVFLYLGLSLQLVKKLYYTSSSYLINVDISKQFFFHLQMRSYFFFYHSQFVGEICWNVNSCNV